MTTDCKSKMQDEKGYCYFLVKEKESHKSIGFCGLSLKDFPSDFTPAVDIGKEELFRRRRRLGEVDTHRPQLLDSTRRHPQPAGGEAHHRVAALL